MTTILDVARRAKVSAAAVSRMLSQPELVREATPRPDRSLIRRSR